MAANAQAISLLTTFQATEAQQWRARIDRENAEWKAGIEDTIRLVSQGITDLGEKIDRLIQALTSIRPNGKGGA